MIALIAASAILFFMAVVVGLLLRRRNLHLWVAGYAGRALVPRPRRPVEGTDVYFCFADHFEPFWGGAGPDLARERVEKWVERYPRAVGGFRDEEGRPPQHTFFYPEEEYDPALLESLAELCRWGLGDVEIHLHHDRDTAEGLRRKLTRFKTVLHERHGLLKRNPDTGEIEYAFIHGNWALANSRRDGRWCGVDGELTVLKETGCYADFTLPSAPDETQTSKINSLYFARDVPGKFKPHDGGRDAEAGYWDEKGLLIIQGPLALNWRSRKGGVLPRIESAEISKDNPLSPSRVNLWARQSIQVKGRPDALFIKVHAHGTQEDNSEALFNGGEMKVLHRLLEEKFRPRNGYRLHYATARKMYDVIRGLCVGARIQEPEASRTVAGISSLSALRGSVLKPILSFSERGSDRRKKILSSVIPARAGNSGARVRPGGEGEGFWEGLL